MKKLTWGQLKSGDMLVSADGENIITIISVVQHRYDPCPDFDLDFKVLWTYNESPSIFVKNFYANSTRDYTCSGWSILCLMKAKDSHE
jgi:hypothetical protein